MLTNKHFHNLHRAHNAIANVLEGRTADGTDAIPYKVSFTHDRQTRAAAAHQLRLIICHCHRILELEDVTPLTIKLLWYFTRTGRQNPEAILAAPIVPIIHAIKHAPHAVRGTGNLLSILRRHAQHKAQERVKQWYAIWSDVPERTLLWSNGLFTLEEATDPRHLIYDTLKLGHCVGKLFDRTALEHHNLTAKDPKALHHLHYWRKIKTGSSRILTLFEADTPRLTIEFHPQTRTILAAQGKITPFGEAVAIPASVKEPLFEAVKTLPIRKGGARLLKSLVFEPDIPRPKKLRKSRVTPL